MIYKTYVLIHDKKHVGIEIKLYNFDTFKKQVDANCIDFDSEFVDSNYKVVSLIYCHFWRRICLLYGLALLIRTFHDEIHRDLKS